MKYRITTRGWFVFSALGILIIALAISLFSQPEIDPGKTDNQTSSQDTQVTESTYESSDDELSTSDVEEETVTEDESPTEVTTEETSTSDDTSPTSTDEENDTSEVEEKEVDLSKETVVMFDKNIAELNEDYHTELNEWIELLQDNDHTITVEGHINGYPYYDDGEYGLRLAEQRAQIVKAYFIDQGIETERVMIVNMGSNKQVSKEADFHLNRRAVIYFNEKP